MSAATVSIDVEILQQLRGEAEKLGINLPGTTRFAPTIDVTAPIRTLALELGQHLALRNLFLRSGDVVTVDEKTGEIKPMNQRRFPAWAEEFVTFKAPGARRVRDSLSADDAGQVLETDIFKGCLRPLTAVHEMVLPVTRKLKEGQTVPDVEFLPPGYDKESGIYTVEIIKYDRTWKLGVGQKWFLDGCKEFPWNATDASAKMGLGHNRSFSLHVMATLGQYCRAMFPPGSLFPIIGYFANKPGTGKTRLAEMAVTPVHGFSASTGAPKDDEKMDVKLETIANAMAPYVILDDIGGGLFSNPLNRFTTESWHTGRIFHSNSEMFKVPNVTQIFVTANDLNTSEDIDRRALIVELFLETEVKGRKFERTITPQWLSLPETRANFLAACCAFVRHWLAKDRPLHQWPLETYEEWTQVLGGMMQACEFADPLQVRERVVGGAQSEDEIKQLLVTVATEQAIDAMVSLKDLIASARKHGLLADLVGSEGDPEPDSDVGKKLGRRMQRWRGQKLKDEAGREFQFSHKKQKKGAMYPLTFIMPSGAVAKPAAAAVVPGPGPTDEDDEA